MPKLPKTAEVYRHPKPKANTKPMRGGRYSTMLQRGTHRSQAYHSLTPRELRWCGGDSVHICLF